MTGTLRDDGGQAIVLVGIVMLGLLMGTGLAIDTGQLYSGRRSAQEAADAAAYAGAVVIYQGGSASSANAAAANDARLNGFAADVPTSGTAVTVSSPPTSGGYSGDASCVRVVISTPVKTTLVPQTEAFTTVVASATACSIAAASKYAVMATDTGDTRDALYLASNGGLAVSGGSLQVNSSSTQAADNKGTVTLSSHTPAYETDVSGGTSGSFPNPQTGKPQQSDPLAGTPLPSTSGLTSQTLSCSPAVNQPGVYNGQSTTNCDYVFAPGTYIYEGGSFTLAGNSSMCTGSTVSTTASAPVSSGSQTVTPASMTNISVGKTLIVDSGSSQEAVSPSAVTSTTFTAAFAKSHSGTWPIAGGCGSPSTADGGVFFFFTNLNYPTETGGCASPQLTGNDATTLSPPSSGTYRGMLLWIDSACGSSAGLTVGGNGAINTTGTIYVPGGTVTGHGNNAVVNASQIVAKDISVQNADFSINYSSSDSYQGPVPSLVE